MNPFDFPLQPHADWRAAGLRYYTLNRFLHWRFGERVWKVSVDGGFRCPNVDGRSGRGGCIYCNIASFSPSRRQDAGSITEQLDEGSRRALQRYGVHHVLAYFQPATNTYAPLQRLRELYEEALAHPAVVGLCIGTRPDCVPNEVLDLLAELSQRTWLCVEYGLQSSHDRSLDWMNRGHHFDAFVDAVHRSHQRDLEIGAHLILGLPGETREDILATAKAMAQMGVNSVKLHNLYVVRGTRLATLLEAGEVRLWSREEFVGSAVDFLEQLPPACVVDRIGGDAPREYFLGPDWCLDKSAVRRAVELEFERRNTWQGRQFEANQSPSGT
jgi:radical SAM protein (TIGR01212 family)